MESESAASTLIRIQIQKKRNNPSVLTGQHGLKKFFFSDTELFAKCFS